MSDLDSALTTPRLTLLVATPTALEASLLPPAEFAAAVGCRVPEDWPPRHWERAPVDWLLAQIAAHPDEPFWRPRFIHLRADDRSTDSAEELLVGTVGFKGPPDAQGAVEVGYSVVASHWRLGIATEAVGAVLGWAGRRPGVRRMRAHTLAGDPASAGVLRKNGFARVGTVTDPDDGEVDRYERPAHEGAGR